METEPNDAKSTITEIKLESIECPTLCPNQQACRRFSHVEIDQTKAECAVKIKEEEDAGTSVPMSDITLDSIDVGQSVSNTGIAPNDIKIKLDLSDDHDLVNIELDEQDTSEGAIVYSKCCENDHCDIYTMELRSEDTKKRLHGRHTKLHIRAGKYKCIVCNKCFTTKRNMLDHLGTHTSELCNNSFPIGNYRCEICNNYFKTKRLLKTHVRTHAEERNYKCEFCNECFTRKYDLMEHVKKHTAERNYKCEICKKWLKLKSNMLQHVKTHTRERNYKCELCSKSFAKKRHLLRHGKTHTGQRNYRCEICNKCFTSKQVLIGHAETHAGEKNYKCEICYKCFATKDCLSKHIKTHTRLNKI